MRYLNVLLGTILSFSAIAQSNQPSEQSIPFRMVVNSGNRPAVKGTINGFPMTFDVHSSASFYMQISHKAADEGKIVGRTHVDTYGISSVGNVSSLGRDSAFVDKLTVGTAQFEKAPVSIFTTPADYNHGMLGLRWITTNRAIVDYKKKVIIVNPTNQSSQAHQKILLSSGYVALPMKRSNEDGRYYITVTINGVSQPMVVSTVANNTLDIEFARRAKLTIVKTKETYGGPTGTTGNVYVTQAPVSIHVGTVPLRLKQVNIFDMYAYEAKKRPAELSAQKAGALAADFLVGNGAVVDFGTQTLYVKPAK